MPQEKFSFTVGFHFQPERAFFDGFTAETVVSDRIGAKYRVLVRNPADNAFYSIQGMEDPKTQDEIDQVLEERYNGCICANEFAFEVYDNENNKIFATRFDVSDRIPTLNNDQEQWTTFSWVFDLPAHLQST